MYHMQKKYTKNIHLYSVNNKLNKNIFELDDQELSSISIPNNISIHKYFYTKNIQDVKSNLFIFNSSIINNELANFIISFSDQLNIWIFLDNEMSEYNSKLKYISNKELDTDAKYKIFENIPVFIHPLINRFGGLIHSHQHRFQKLESNHHPFQHITILSFYHLNMSLQFSAYLYILVFQNYIFYIQ